MTGNTVNRAGHNYMLKGLLRKYINQCKTKKSRCILKLLHYHPSLADERRRVSRTEHLPSA